MYSSLEASLHDHFWDSEAGPGELPILRSFLTDFRGPSLEIGCGSGRLLLPLLKDGYQIEGLENSRDMISLLNQKAVSMDLQPTIHHSDATQAFPTKTAYAAYLIPAFTLQLFSRKDATSLLRRLRNRSLTQPKLYLTVFIPWLEITGELAEETWHHDKEITLDDHSIARCDTAHTIDRLSQTLFRDHRYTVTSPNGHDTTSHHSTQTIAYYGLPELRCMLENTGWNIDQVITDLDPSTPNTDAHILTIEATAK